MVKVPGGGSLSQFWPCPHAYDPWLPSFPTVQPLGTALPPLSSRRYREKKGPGTHRPGEGTWTRQPLLARYACSNRRVERPPLQ